MIIKVLFLNVLFLLLLNGCASKNSSCLVNTEHVTETNTLDLIMHDLDLVVNDDSKSELELDDERRRYAITLADTLEKLSLNIEKLPLETIANSISPKDMKLFSTYTKKLNKHAEGIRLIAQRYELEKLPGKIEEVKQTCNNCHAQLRSY